MLVGLFFDASIIGLIIGVPIGIIGFIMLLVGLFTSGQKYIPVAGGQQQQQVVYMTPPPQQAPAMTPMPSADGKFCPNCGARISKAATFCAACGQKQPALS